MYDHWLVRGAQSAIFYYISCGPCYAASYKRKRRKEAIRDRKTHQSRANERPDAYRHPAPFEINPYWQEEMTLGPSPPPRRKRKKTKESAGKRGITTAGTYSSLNSSGSESQKGPTEPGEAHISSFGRRRYHRPDEEFAWIGEEEEQNAESGGRSPKWNYQCSKVPPVNDLHPPIVSLIPTKAEDRRWMKQPPPSTAFMQGKKGVTTIERTESAEIRAASTATTRPLSQQSTRGREPSRSSEMASRPQVDGTTNRQPLDGVKTTGSAGARQHSGISTVKRHSSARPIPATSGATSAETSDADDEDESPQPQLPTKPRPSYRLDVPMAPPKPLRTRQLNSRQSSTNPQNGPSQSSSSLKPYSTSENISPRNSPRSVASRPYSRVSSSSEDDAANTDNGNDNETTTRLQVPNFTTTSTTTKPASTARARSTSNNPRAASKHRKADKSHGRGRASLEPEASGVDSAIMIDDTDLDLSYAGLDEDKARERMWLGAPGEEVSRLVKRWSSEF